MAEGVQVEGVRELLKALKQIDPELRKRTVAEIKAPGRIILASARASFPVSPPMSRWRPGERSGFPRWNGGAQRGVKLKFGGKARRDRRQWPLLEIKQGDPAGAVFDMAGKRGGNGTRQSEQFLANLRRFSQPSRAMWPAVEKHQPEVMAALAVAVKKAEAEINARTGR